MGTTLGNIVVKFLKIHIFQVKLYTRNKFSSHYQENNIFRFGVKYLCKNYLKNRSIKNETFLKISPLRYIFNFHEK